MCGAALIAIVIEKVAYEPLRNTPVITPMLSTLGFSIILQNVATNVWGSRPAVPQLLDRRFDFGLNVSSPSWYDEGYLSRNRQGRRNVYEVYMDRPLRHPLEAGCTIGKMLELLRDADMLRRAIRRGRSRRSVGAVAL